MAGWTSFSDFINEVTVNQKYMISPFAKVSANGGAGTARYWYEYYTATGNPAAGPLTGAAGTGTQIKQSVQGCGIPIGANVSTDIRSLLSLQMVSPTATVVPAYVYLVDFLIYHPACVVTGTPTTLSAVSLPRYTDGKGVYPIIAVQSVFGAAVPSLTLTCTYDDDSSAAMAQALVSPANSAVTTTLLAYGGSPLGCLPAGKLGVKAVGSYAINSGGTTGTAAIFLVKVLAQIPLVAQSVTTERDFLNQIPGAPRIYDDAVLGFIISPGGAMATSSVLMGAVGMGWG